jgi:hypothetical protein
MAGYGRNSGAAELDSGSTLLVKLRVPKRSRSGGLRGTGLHGAVWPHRRREDARRSKGRRRLGLVLRNERAQGLCGVNLRAGRGSWGGAPRERPANSSARIAASVARGRETSPTEGPGLSAAGEHARRRRLGPRWQGACAAEASGMSGVASLAGGPGGVEGDLGAGRAACAGWAEAETWAAGRGVGWRAGPAG